MYVWISYKNLNYLYIRKFIKMSFFPQFLVFLLIENINSSSLSNKSKS